MASLVKTSLPSCRSRSATYWLTIPARPLGGHVRRQPGTAKVQREYTRVLNSRFILGQNKSVYLDLLRRVHLN